MAQQKTIPTIRFNHSAQYQQEYDTYTLQLVHKKRPWWLLLLLLPLLLLIQCHKDITVNCLEPDSQAPIEDVPVTMSYQAHLIFDKGFVWEDSISLTQKTDENGTTVFRDLPCSVFSYIFYCLSEASFTAKSDCHQAVEEKHNFHYSWTVDLNMQPRREDLHIQLLDLETNDPLPDGYIVYTFNELGEVKTDSAKADPSGVVTIPQMRFCANMDLLLGRCYGYADTTRVDIPCQQLLLANDSTAMRLRPIKERFDFFVKNKVTKEPIPGASCMVTLTRPKPSTSVEKKTVTTSLDGKGMAFYDDAFILATIAIHASKQHYKDGDLEGGPWTVEEFLKLDTLTRTIWLEPEPYVEEFQNVDSITGKPIKVVKNIITVTEPDGKKETYTEISNSNGKFPVKATEDAEIEIISIKDPDYVQKRTYHRKFKDIKDRKIPMRPVMVTLKFRTVMAESPNTLLPNCNLKVSGSISNALKPTNSGTGEFEVTFRRGELLSIAASKSGYRNTTNKVTSQSWDYLQVDQSRRDIPLKRDPVVYENPGHPQGISRDCYDLKAAPSDFLFEWDVCSVCTMLTVYDDNGNMLGQFGINSPGGDGQGTVYSPASGSTVLHSQTQNICVVRQCVNGDKGWYRISTR